MMKRLSRKYVNVLLSIMIASFTLITAVSSFPQSASASTTNLYASPTGSGTTCSSGSPCSLTGAQTKVRTLNTGTMTGNIVVNLQGGTYTLASTFALTNADSGNSGYKVIYQNDTGVTPVISGGTQITGWTLHDSVNNIWQASVSSTLRFRQLYVNGTRDIRARTPNLTSTNDRGSYYAATTGMSGSAPYTFGVNSSELASWANLNQVEVVMIDNWKQKRARISSYSGGTISFLSPENSDPVMNHFDQSGTPHYYENAYEFIDAEGEWYLNTTTNILYYKPRTGETMSTATVIAPNLDNLVTVTGANNTTNMAQNIQITGITFQYSNMTLPNSIGYLNYQAGIKYGNSVWPLGTYYPGAIQLQNSKNITISYNTIQHTGAQGILALDDTQNSIFDHNIITDTSSGGIYLGLRTSNSSGNQVTYNTITYGGIEYTDAVGIFIEFAPYAIVNHNEVAYYRYTGISAGLDWSDSATTATNIEIGYNYIHDVMLLHDDGGGIYTLGKIPNMNIHDNYIKSLSGSVYNGGFPIGGIYLDNGSTGKTVQNNVIDSVPNTFYANNSPNYGNTIQNNYYNSALGTIAGTNTVTGNTSVSGAWTTAAQTIINNAGTGTGTTVVDDSDGSITYSGSWTHATGATGYYNNTFSYTNTTNDYVQFTFTGTSITWINAVASNRGIVHVYVDGADQGTVDLYSSTNLEQQIVFQKTGLTSGSHTIKLVETGTKNASSSGYYLDLDAFAYTSALTTSELLSNPGFESGLSPWSAFGGGSLTLVTTGAHSGTNASREYSRTGTWFGATQNITSILSSNGQGNYNVSGWAKLGTGSDTVYITVQIIDSSGTHYVSTSGSTVGTGWTQLSGTLNLTWTGTLTSAIYYVQTGTSLADLYVDDGSLQKAVELLSNPGFESGLSPWSAFGGGSLTLVTTGAHSGTNASQEYSRTGTWFGATQNITSILSSNGQRNYNVSAWAKLGTGSDTVYITVQIIDSSGTHYVSTSGSTVGTGWTQLSGTLNLTWTGTLTSAIYYVQTGTSLADLYVDDGSLQ